MTNTSLAHLNDLSYPELREWLAEALRGHRPLPRLSTDEPPDVAILARENTLDKVTRRDLAGACAELVRGFMLTGDGTIEFVRALLHLAVGLGLRELTGELAAMAERFPEMPDLELEVRQAVLLTIVDLGELQPAEFWRHMLHQDADAYAGAALSGLLARSFAAGLEILPRLPSAGPVVSAIAMILDQALEDRPEPARSECLAALDRAAASCPAALREALREVIAEYGDGDTPPHANPSLLAAIARRVPRLQSLLGVPASPRLVPGHV